MRAMHSEVVKRNEELERQVKDLQKKLAKSEQELQYFKYKLEQFRHMLFGQKSEKTPTRTDGLVQLELFNEAAREIRTEEFEEAEGEREARKNRRGNRKPIPKEFRRERVVIDVDPELRTCPDCGDAMQRIGEHISEELEYVPALLYVIEYALQKYACKKCQSGVVMERVPERPIKKGRPGPGLLAYILVSKYQDHMPLNRLERIFARHGLELSRKTLSGWVQAMGELLEPIVEEMKRELFRARVLQADETPLKVKDPEIKGRTKQAFLYTYGQPQREVVYDFRMNRSRDGPLGFLEGFEGYLQTDAYAGYNELFRRGRVVRIGCWAHVRRKFHDARGERPEFSQIIIAAIQKLYRIEREAKSKGLTGEARVSYRREHAPQVLEKIKALLEIQRPRVLPKSGTGGAIGYTLSQWEALCRYVDIAEAEIDNNAAEQSMRGIAVGRRNWLFVGHPNAGPRAATILSLVETCRRLGLEPLEYLREVISEITKEPGSATRLTPRAWLESHPPAKAEKDLPKPSE